MKALDYIFYIFLCVFATLAFFIYNMHADLYFPALSVDNSYGTNYEFAGYEKDSININLQNVSAINLAKISNEKYLLTFLRDENMESKLYGILFSPNKYSMQDISGRWQSVAINSKNWGNLKLLATNTSLFSNLRQIVKSFSNPILQVVDKKLFLFVNGRNFERMNTEKIFVFESEIDDIFRYLSADSKDFAPFRFYKKITLGALFNLNYLLSSKTFFINLNDNTDNFMLPVYADFFYPISLFAIFDSHFHLKEMLRPNTAKNLYKPLITSLAEYENNVNIESNLNHISRKCLAIYHNLNANAPLSFQTCDAINGNIIFSDVIESKNIRNIGELSIATLGAYTFLLYLDENARSVNLAIFEDGDFKFLRTIDSVEAKSSSAFISPNIITNGLYAYITYGDTINNKINIITINENYLKYLFKKD